jgi:hypothetical protein
LKRSTQKAIRYVPWFNSVFQDLTIGKPLLLDSGS